LPTTRQSRGDGHRLLVTPERVLSEYNEELIFFKDITVCATLVITGLFAKAQTLLNITEKSIEIFIVPTNLHKTVKLNFGRHRHR